MRSTFWVSVLVLCSACATPDLPSRGWEPLDELRHSNFLVGALSFEDDDFGRLDDQLLIGLDYAEPIGLGPVRLEGGLHYSYDEANERLSSGAGESTRADMLELSAGLNYAFGQQRLRPYAGLGAALYFVQLRALDAQRDELSRDSDVTMGGYGKVGILFRVSPRSHIGIEYRRGLGGALTIDDRDIDVDFHQVALVFGTSFR